MSVFARSVIAVLSLLIASTGLIGCADPVPITPGDITADALDLGDLQTPTRPVDCGQLTQAMLSGDGRFLVVTEGDDARTYVSLTATEDQRFGATWRTDERLTAGDAERQPQVLRTEYWQQTETDGLLVKASIEHEENAMTLFDPPLRLFPQYLEHGSPQTYETSMRVVEAGNPARQRESGVASRTVEYLGDVRLETAEGVFKAACIRIRFVADMRFADAEEQTLLFVDDQGQRIAEHRSKHVVILGVPGRDDQRLIVRASSDQE